MPASTPRCSSSSCKACGYNRLASGHAPLDYSRGDRHALWLQWLGGQGANGSGRRPAHAHRKFHDLHTARASAITTEAVRRIAELYVIEAEIRGKPPHERQQVREQRSRPLLDDFGSLLRATLEKLSRKSATAEAILYALNLWPALTRYCNNGPSRSITRPLNGRCAVSPSAGATTCSSASTAVANGRPRSTR